MTATLTDVEKNAMATLDEILPDGTASGIWAVALPRNGNMDLVAIALGDRELPGGGHVTTVGQVSANPLDWAARLEQRAYELPWPCMNWVPAGHGRWLGLITS